MNNIDAGGMARAEVVELHRVRADYGAALHRTFLKGEWLAGVKPPEVRGRPGSTEAMVDLGPRARARPSSSDIGGIQSSSVRIRRVSSSSGWNRRSKACSRRASRSKTGGTRGIRARRFSAARNAMHE